MVCTRFFGTQKVPERCSSECSTVGNRLRRALRRNRDGAGLWLVMLLILFVHPLFGDTGDALDSAVWVFEQIGAVSVS